MKKRLILTIALGLLTACSDPTTTDPEALKQFLINLSGELNKQLPEQVEENTILEATSGYGSQFTYYYTLLNYAYKDIDKEAFIQQMTPALIQNTCNTDSQEPLVSRGVTLNYVYSDKELREFAAIQITPETCNTAT